MIAQDLALALDPAMLAERVGLSLDPWQADLMRAQDKQAILLCSRQSGKSTVTSLIALHEALYRAPALVLLLARSQRQAGELFRKVKHGYNALGRPVPTVQESVLSLELANGSRIVALPGSEETIRGFSGVALLIEDEAARVPDELYLSIRPMLAVSGGRLILLSTPWGRRGHFHDVWHEGGSAWRRVRITAEQCPRIPAEFLEAERAAMGDWWYRQEYGCEFVDTEETFFSYDAIQAALVPETPALFAGINPYERVPA